MSQAIEIIRYGSLRETRITTDLSVDNLFPLSEATPLAKVLDQLTVRGEEIQLVMLNHRAVSDQAIVRPGDRLALFPKEYPIFIDWNGYRM